MQSIYILTSKEGSFNIYNRQTGQYLDEYIPNRKEGEKRVQLLNQRFKESMSKESYEKIINQLNKF